MIQTEIRQIDAEAIVFPQDSKRIGYSKPRGFVVDLLAVLFGHRSDELVHSHFVFFGSILRLFFEGYLEFTIAICIGAVNLNWEANQGFAVAYCNVLTILIGIILAGLFIYIPVYYLVNIDLLD